MIVVVLLAVVAVITVLAAAHWYVWRRLVRDLTTSRKARIVGAVVVTALPLISVAAQFSARSGVPFQVQQILAWPGFLWLAVLLYLVLFLVAGEVVRFVWLRAAARRDARTGAAAPLPAAEPAAVPVPVAVPADLVPADTAIAEAVPGSTMTADTEHGDTVTVDIAAPERAAAAPVGPGTPDDPADRPAARPGGVSRRMFVSRVVGGGAAAAALGTVGLGTYSVLNGPTLKRVTVPLAKLPRSAHGFRIAVVSDIHLGPILGRAHTQRIVDTINSANPDLIAVVGDMVDGNVDDLGPAAEPLTQLRARHGSFFVTGNHEYFSGAEQWVDHVRELGLRPLENERVEIAAGFDLAGVDDPEGEREGKGPDFDRALGDRDRGRTAVLLAHQPVVIHDAVKHGVDLQLSGHTHGGQLWPGEYLAALANPTVAGLERYGDTQLYVTRGAGAWGPPVRVGAESDITVVQLASRQA
ncbi:metallophosphoesterase [Streptomyces qinzhouensis]|uniref:Metallophosphoesterase n=1 Tax=Streptomyces qinzhouensis TaxID=2599401 RepID=A0A5B8JBD9_9ACTN|nr:metallophosphoesterase [Streptomyces qinzhouensis]QDY78636.1 metallophosphoesterase [Streptomyces qinzhouensis]